MQPFYISDIELLKVFSSKTRQVSLFIIVIKLTDQEYNLVVARLKEILRNTPKLHIPTQKKVSIPIVIRIAKKIQNGLFASTIVIKDNKICGGHHRYLATLLTNKIPEILPGELSYGHSSYE